MGRKKYEEGGEVDPLEAANASTEAQELAGEAILKGMRDKAAAEPSNFKEAFAAARGRGDKTFEFGGKKFTTEMASAKPARAAAPRPAENYGNEGRSAKAPLRQVTQDELADSYVKKQAARKAEAAADRAAKAEVDAETARLARKAPARARGARIDTAGLNPNTLLPSKQYKKGGSVRGWGIARGARKAKIV